MFRVQHKKTAHKCSLGLTHMTALQLAAGQTERRLHNDKQHAGTT